MSSRNVIALALATALVGPWVSPGARASTLSKMEWQAGTEGKTESLVLHFSQGIPNLDVDTESWGLSVWLPGMKLDSVGAEGIRVQSEPEGTRMRVERPGIELRSVRVEGDSVRLLLGRSELGVAMADSTYRIGVGDVVSVVVYKNTDLSGEYTVAPDGTLNLPLVGTILAKGLTDTGLTARLREALEKDFLVDPQVAVTIKTYQSQWVYIAGSVAKAQRVPVSPSMSIKDILAEAGIALGPGQQIVLTRAGGSGESIVIDDQMVDTARLPMPRDGDVLTIQEPSYVFVQGEVRRPGRIPLIPSMTVLQAITVVEGLTEWANKKDVRIRRTVGGETAEEVVNLRKVEERKAPDPELKPGDLILVRRKVL